MWRCIGCQHSDVTYRKDFTYLFTDRGTKSIFSDKCQWPKNYIDIHSVKAMFRATWEAFVWSCMATNLSDGHPIM